jgi:hypothetical protein
MHAHCSYKKLKTGAKRLKLIGFFLSIYSLYFYVNKNGEKTHLLRFKDLIAYSYQRKFKHRLLF